MNNQLTSLMSKTDKLTRPAILAALFILEHGGAVNGTEPIRHHLGCGDRHLYKVLKELRDNSVVVAETDPNKGNRKIYKLKEAQTHGS